MGTRAPDTAAGARFAEPRWRPAPRHGAAKFS